MRGSFWKPADVVDPNRKASVSDIILHSRKLQNNTRQRTSRISATKRTTKWVMTDLVFASPSAARVNKIRTRDRRGECERRADEKGETSYGDRRLNFNRKKKWPTKGTRCWTGEQKRLITWPRLPQWRAATAKSTVVAVRSARRYYVYTVNKTQTVTVVFTLWAGYQTSRTLSIRSGRTRGSE